jgi:hypothetical protein
MKPNLSATEKRALVRTGRLPRCKRRAPAAAAGAVRPGPAPGAGLISLLSREVQELDEDHRLPVTLCYELRLSRCEAAEILGVDVDTLCRRLEAGLIRLCASLARAGHPVVPAVMICALNYTAPPVPPTLVATVEKIIASFTTT